MGPFRVVRLWLAGVIVAAGIGVACSNNSPTTPTPVPSPTPTTPSCASVGDAPSVALAPSGAEFSIAVTAAAGCAWTTASSAAFISPTGPTAGAGTGSARFAVQPNSGPPRQGRVLVAGRELSVAQTGTETTACAFQVTPTERTVAPQGGDVAVTIQVTEGADCAWTAASQSAFLTIASAASGTGPGGVTLTVANNPGPARVGTVSIAGRTVTVLQEATAPSICAFSVTPTQTSLTAAGGNVSVTVTKTQGDACPWIAQPQAPFLSISGGSSGVDNGVVTIVVAPNGGSARGGSVNVAGRMVSITQAGPALPCALSLVIPQADVNASGGSATAFVKKDQGDVCPWTAQSQSPFITVLSGGSGVNDGTVALRVDPNTGAERQGTVLIAGRTFTVRQASPNSPCGFRVAPAEIPAGAAQMSSMIYLTQIAGQNCAWTAQSSAPFVRSEPASGVISGLPYASVLIFVDANTGPARTATVTFGNAVVSISQAGAAASTSAAVLTFESDATDDVGQGQSQSVTITGAQFELTSNTASGTLRFNTPFGANPRLNLDLAAPTGQPLAPGYYPLAQSFASVPAAGVAGVGFRYNGRSCNTLTGRLLVQEAVYGPGDTVVRFHARFEQHCNGASAGLRGTIWIDAQGSTSPPALAPFPASDAGTTSFSYQSEAGDVIGGGGSGSFTLASATFTPTTSGPEIAVTIRPVPTGTIWTLQFRGPTGAQLLAGTYDPSIDPLQAGTANLRVTGPGFCTGVPLTGKFTVLEAAYGSPGTVLRFRATFEVRCGTATATLRGEVRILADPWR